MVLLCLMFLCDIVYSKIYRDGVPRNKLHYIINLKKESFDVVFLGSSRVANHIDTELFNKLSHKRTINLGVEGAGLNDNLLQIKLLLEHNKVASVFLQIDSNLETTEPSNIATAEAMPYINNAIVQAHTRNYDANYEWLYYIPFYRYAINDAKIGFRELFFSLLNKKPRIDPSMGYTPKFGNAIPNTPRAIMGEKTVLHGNSILNEIRLLCKQKNTKLVLFITPFCSKINADSYIQKMRKIAPDLLDLTKGYPDGMFYNCGHLNDAGAKKLTKALYDATKIP